MIYIVNVASHLTHPSYFVEGASFELAHNTHADRVVSFRRTECARPAEDSHATVPDRFFLARGRGGHLVLVDPIWRN